MDFQLTEQEKALRDLARDFGQRYIRPGLLEREWEMDSAKRIPWDLVEAAFDAGLGMLTVPAEYGGPDPATSQLARALVAEELGAADPGFAILWGHQVKDPAWIAAAGSKEQKDWFFPRYMKDNRFLMATAETEPDHGSDWQLPYEGFHMNTSAVLDGDEWVINGEKTSISNGAEAKVIILTACTDPSVPATRGSSVFLVPRGPGITATVHPKVGMRLCNNARVSFDNVRVPKNFLVGELNNAWHVRRTLSGENALMTCAAKVGLARSAYEEAVQYAHTRVQGGKPIVGHQMIGTKLAECYALVEAMRAMVYRYAWMVEHKEELDPKYGSGMVWYCAETCYRVATLGMQVCGCGGGWLSLFGQKHVRDAMVHFPNDGTHGLQLLRVAGMIENQQVPVRV